MPQSVGGDHAPSQVRLNFFSSRLCLSQKVGDKDHDGSLGNDFGKEFQRGVEFGPSAFGFKEKNVADDAQDVETPFARGNELFDNVGEEQQADFVVIFDGGKRQNRGDFGGEFSFGLFSGTKKPGAAKVDE